MFKSILILLTLKFCLSQIFYEKEEIIEFF